MSDNRSGNNLSSILKYLSVEELEELLSRDFDMSGNQEPDIEYIMAIMEEIQKRESAVDRDSLESCVNNAWEDFCENYLSSSHTFETVGTKRFSAPEATARKKSYRPLRYILIAALIGLLMCSAATAFGFNVFGAVGEWSKDIFYFSTESLPVASDSSEPAPSEKSSRISSLQAEVDALGISEKVVPSWIPDAYTLEESNVKHMQRYTKIRATFVNDTKEFTITIRAYSAIEDASNVIIEKSDEPVEVYVVNDIPHYIFSNLDIRNASWINNTVHCLISGDVSEEEIKTMIDSIYS